MLCRALLLLAQYPEKQQKLREELLRTHGLDYDKLMGLPYLDAVVRETLRVYPPASTLIRV